MASLARKRYKPEEYLVLEREAEHKSEYVNGQIYAMSGASREHNIIAGNLFRDISSHFVGKPCEAYVGDMRVYVNLTGAYTYPDVIAVCGEPLFIDTGLDTLLNPTVLIEVLSPSTEAYDQNEKFAHYRRLNSLMEYILVAQDSVRIEHFVRQGSGSNQWLLTEISSLDETLVLNSISCEIEIVRIYDKVTFGDADSYSDGPGA